jgi:hypothetical protein
MTKNKAVTCLRHKCVWLDGSITAAPSSLYVYGNERKKGVVSMYVCWPDMNDQWGALCVVLSF